MKKIEVIFRPEKLEPLKEKLLAAGVQGVTIYQVHGCGNQHGWIAYHRGNISIHFVGLQYNITLGNP